MVIYDHIWTLGFSSRATESIKLMMRTRENPHHRIWATRVIWRYAVHTILYDFRTTYKPLSCSHAQKNDDFPATCKPYSCSHAAKKQRLPCHLQPLQLFPRDRKTTIFLPLTILTVVPTQQKNNDCSLTYKPYSCSHAIEKR